MRIQDSVDEAVSSLGLVIPSSLKNAACRSGGPKSGALLDYYLFFPFLRDNTTPNSVAYKEQLVHRMAVHLKG